MIDSNTLAPIVVFAYNRVDHLQKTLKALSENDLAIESDLFIFVDGSKNSDDFIKVTEVYNFLNNYQFFNYFKSFTIFNSEINKGLASSIIDGVTKIIRQYDKIIVVEDDVLTSPYFLIFMNDALNKYSRNQRIGSVSSYVPNIIIPKNYNQSVFLSMRPSSIAWGTWLNRWEKVDWNFVNYSFQKYNLLFRFKINSWGNDVAGRLDRYKVGLNDSWAVRFTVHGILNDLFSIHPIETLTEHIGYDNSGTNSSIDDLKRFSVNISNLKSLEIPILAPSVNKLIKKEFQQKYKRPILSVIGEYILIVLLRLKPNSKIIKMAHRLSFQIKKLIE